MATNYLKNPADFESVINRKSTIGLSGLNIQRRSDQLKRLKEAIESYSKEKTSERLTFVEMSWNDWKAEQFKEFNDRAMKALPAPATGTLAEAFEREMKMEISFMQTSEEFPAPPANAVNRHRISKGMQTWGTGDGDGMPTRHKKLKSAATTAMGNAGTAQTVAVTGAAAVGVGLGTGGVALAGAVAVSPFILAGLAAKSLRSTLKHLEYLQKLYVDREGYTDLCAQLMLPGGYPDKNDYSRRTHDIVANRVLPYVIEKKEKKAWHKGAGAIALVPVIGQVAVGISSAYKAGSKMKQKYYTHDYGYRRERAAGWLAAHFVECDCRLAQEIVGNLYSLAPEEMASLQQNGEYRDIAKLLVDKMESS